LRTGLKVPYFLFVGWVNFLYEQIGGDFTYQVNGPFSCESPSRLPSQSTSATKLHLFIGGFCLGGTLTAPGTPIQPNNQLIINSARRGKEPKKQLARLVLVLRDGHETRIRLSDIKIYIGDLLPIDPVFYAASVW